MKEGKLIVNTPESKIRTPIFNAFRERWLKPDHPENRSEDANHTSITGKILLKEKALVKDVVFTRKTSINRLKKYNRADFDYTSAKIRVVTSHITKSDVPSRLSPEQSPGNLSNSLVSIPFSSTSRPDVTDFEPDFPVRQVLSRPPRTKAEALNEVTLVIDDRLYIQLMPIIGNPERQQKFSHTRLFADNVIIWKRKSFNSEIEVSCQFALLVFNARDIYPEIRTGKPQTIIEFLRRWKSKLPSQYKEVYFLIIGGKFITQKIVSEINREFRRCVLTGSRLKLTPTKTLPTWSELERSLWINGINEEIRVQFLDQAGQLAEHLFEITKCVSWQPYANAHEKHNFCASVGRKSGKTLTETWRLMLEEISRVTPSIAEAIIGAYPTVRSLLTQYESLPATTAADLLSGTICSGQRTIGPALSRKIYKILTSSDPDQRANL